MISWVSYQDVAEFAVRCAENNNPAHNRILEIGRPEDLSPSEVIRIFEHSAVQPMLGFKKFYNARRVLIGVELLQKLNKGQFRKSKKSPGK